MRGGGRPSMMAFLPVLVALDANKDGEISSKELDNAAAALRTLDKNGDGKLTEDEVRPSRPPGGGRPGGFGGRGGEMRGGPGGQQGRGFGGPGGEQGRGRPDPAQMVERIMAYDKNGDGKLGKDELSERMQGMIDRADTNGDGFASKEELTKLVSQGGGGGRRGGEGGGGARPDGRRGGSESSGTTKPRRPEFDN